MKSKRVLIIDCQLLQTTALHRGMGKYTLAFLEEYDRIDLPYDEIVIVLNESNIGEKDEQTLKSKLKGFTVKRLPLLKTNPVRPELYDEVARANSRILNEYVNSVFAESAIDFLITSLFHEDGCSVFPARAINRYMLVYDLIPLQFPDYYLDDPRGRTQYLSRFKEFFKATHYFTISETVGNDLSLSLGVPATRITAINGSYVSRKKIKQAIPKGFFEDEKFILMPTGDDVRKNNLRATMAFEEFNSKSGYQYKLILTSFFGEKTKKELMVQSDHLIFTGNVSDEELAWLYSKAELIFFPSEYEGLGMPPLEAVELNKPVLCSNITVFKEITASAFYFCDPYSILNMTEQLQTILISSGTKTNSKEYARILKKYQWSNTANMMVDVFRTKSKNKVKEKTKKRIAVFAPIPSGYSAIGKVVQEQHYVLSQSADVDYYLEEGITQRAKESKVRINYLPYVAKVKNPWSFSRRDVQKYEQIIYHIGNSEYHVVSAVKALAFPGTAVLHDTDINGMLGIIKSLGYISHERFENEAKLQEALFTEKDISNKTRKSNYIASIVNTSNKIITHSNYAHEAVDQVKIEGIATQNVRAELPSPVPYSVYGRNSSSSDHFVISFAGIIHAAKGLDLVSEIAHTVFSKPVHIKLFGYSLIDEEVRTKLLLNENVEIIESPSDTRFIHELRESDLVIGYRPSYHGETSLSTIEALRLGRGVVVNDVGWFSEIPDGLVYKISKMNDIKKLLTEIIEDGSIDTAVHERLSYVQTKHSIAKYIDLITEK